MTVYNRKYEIWSSILTAYFALGQKSFLVVLQTHQKALFKGLIEIRVRTIPRTVIHFLYFHKFPHVSNIVMLTINSRSPWEMISGFNFTATRSSQF